MKVLQQIDEHLLKTLILHPEGLWQQTNETLLSLAQSTIVPRSFLEYLIAGTKEEIEQVAKLNINWKGDDFSNWRSELYTYFETSQIGQNDRLAIELMKLGPVPPQLLSRWIPGQKLISGLRNPHVSLDYRYQYLAKLSRSLDLEGRLAAAESTNTPLEYLTNLCGDITLPIRLAVRHNPALPDEIVSQVDEAHAIAENWQTDTTKLVELSHSHWPWIRLAVARNPFAGETALMHLALDPLINIQLAIAENPGSPESVLDKLAENSEPLVRKALTSNPNASISLLLKLMEDYQSLIKQRSDLPASIIQIIFDDAISQGSGNDIFSAYSFAIRQSQTPESILDFISEYDLDGIRNKINTRRTIALQNEDLSRYIFKKLTSYLLGVINHQNTTKIIIEKLKDHPDTRVKLAVAKHPLLKSKYRKKLYSELIKNADTKNLCKISEDPNTPIDVLNKILENELLESNLEIAVRRVINSKTSGFKPYMTEAYTYMDIFLRKFPKGTFLKRKPLLDIATTPEVLLAIKNRQICSTQWHLHFQAEFKKIFPNYTGYSSKSIVEAFCTVLLRIGHDTFNRDQKRPIKLSLLQNSSISLDNLERLYSHLTFYKSDTHSERHLCETQLAFANNSKVPEEKRSELYQILEGTFIGRELLKKHKERLNEVQDNSFENIERSDENQQFIKYRSQLAALEIEEIGQTDAFFSHRPECSYAQLRIVEGDNEVAKYSIARNPNTSISLLERLARDPSESVRSVLLQNRNLPHSVQLILMQDESIRIRCILAQKDLFKDPPCDVLLALANDPSEQVRAAVAKNPCVPVSILTQLANDLAHSVKQGLASNPNTPSAILNRLGLEENILDVRNPNTPGIVLTQAVHLYQSGRYTSPTHKKGLSHFLKHPVKGSQMPPNTLLELAAHPDADVRYRVAQHPNTPSEALELLVNDSYIPTLRAIADNVNTPSHLLEQLAHSPDMTTRLSVIRNPNTAPYILRDVVQICLTSGNSPNRTVDGLKSAFPGSAIDILIEIARLPQTPVEALEILAQREFVLPLPDPKSIIPLRSADDVIQSLTTNPSLGSKILLILSQDPCLEVRKSIISHPNLTIEHWSKLVKDEATEIRKTVAAQAIAPTKILAQLATDPCLEVRCALAQNCHSPATTLIQLSQDKDLSVRCAVAANQNTPVDRLVKLSKDAKVEVRRAIATNPNTPSDLQEQLSDLRVTIPPTSLSPTLQSLPYIYNPQTDDLAEALHAYTNSNNSFVRFVTLLHPLINEERLMQAANSLSWLERYAVASNPITPRELITLLEQDGNYFVRAAALRS